MNRIDYIHPSAVEQIQKAMHGETVPSNDGNRDGMVNDVRYFSDYALSQIRGVDLGPEFKPAEVSRYKVIFGVPTVVSQDPLSLGVSVLGIKDFTHTESEPNDYFCTLELTQEQATIIIGTFITTGVELMGAVCAMVVKDCPEDVLPVPTDVLVPGADVLKYAATEYPFVNGAVVEHYLDKDGSALDFSSGLYPLGKLSPELNGFHIIVLDTVAPYSMAQLAAIAGGEVPDSILTMYRYDYSNDGYIQIRVRFPYFELPTPQE